MVDQEQVLHILELKEQETHHQLVLRKVMLEELVHHVMLEVEVVELGLWVEIIQDLLQGEQEEQVLQIQFQVQQ
jgi:hypothetical protein